MGRDIVFEVCAEDLEACVAARDGGADRIELCCALSEGGLTPSHALTTSAVVQSGLPVYGMLRPRGGGYSMRSMDIVCSVSFAVNFRHSFGYLGDTSRKERCLWPKKLLITVNMATRAPAIYGACVWYRVVWRISPTRGAKATAEMTMLPL